MEVDDEFVFLAYSMEGPIFDLTRAMQALANPTGNSSFAELDANLATAHATYVSATTDLRIRLELSAARSGRDADYGSRLMALAGMDLALALDASQVAVIPTSLRRDPYYDDERERPEQAEQLQLPWIAADSHGDLLSTVAGSATSGLADETNDESVDEDVAGISVEPDARAVCERAASTIIGVAEKHSGMLLPAVGEIVQGVVSGVAPNVRGLWQRIRSIARDLLNRALRIVSDYANGRQLKIVDWLKVALTEALAATGARAATQAIWRLCGCSTSVAAIDAQLLRSSADRQLRCLSETGEVARLFEDRTKWINCAAWASAGVSLAGIVLGLELPIAVIGAGVLSAATMLLAHDHLDGRYFWGVVDGLPTRAHLALTA